LIEINRLIACSQSWTFCGLDERHLNIPFKEKAAPRDGRSARLILASTGPPEKQGASGRRIAHAYAKRKLTLGQPFRAANRPSDRSNRMLRVIAGRNIIGLVFERGSCMHPRTSPRGWPSSKNFPHGSGSFCFCSPDMKRTKNWRLRWMTASTIDTTMNETISPIQAAACSPSSAGMRRWPCTTADVRCSIESNARTSCGSIRRSARRRTSSKNCARRPPWSARRPMPGNGFDTRS
jgi:hypothetical protein